MLWRVRILLLEEKGEVYFLSRGRILLGGQGRFGRSTAVLTFGVNFTHAIDKNKL